MKTWIFSLLVAAAVNFNAHAETSFLPEVNARFKTVETKKTIKVVYDVTANTTLGETGTHGTGKYLPANAIITRSWIYINTLFVDSGSGTVAIQCEDANNILSAFDMTTRAAGLLMDGVSTGTTGSMTKSIAAPCEIKVVVATAAQTAGKMTFYVEYVSF